MTNDALDGLLEKLCSGDAAAAEQVFVAYEPYLRKVVRRLLPTELRAKFDSLDVVQSVWGDVLSGFRAAGWRFANTIQLQSFLVTVTRNRFIDHCRRHGPSLRHEQPLPQTDEAPNTPQTQPADQAQASELWDRMLALCPPEHLELLRWKRDGFSNSEVAARSGLHPGSVRRILRDLAVRLAVRAA